MRAALMCGSCRFTLYYLFAFWLGVFASGRVTVGLLVFGVVYWFLHNMATEWLNRVSDVTEDEVNRRERTLICHEAGYPLLRRLAWWTWGLVACLDVGWVVQTKSLALGVTLAVVTLGAINYSVGLRMKKRPYLAFAALALPLGPATVGWAAAGAGLSSSGPGTLVAAGCVILFVALLSASLTAMKDLTDVSGDREIGFEGLWVRIVRTGRRWLSPAVVSVPYGVVVIGVGLGLVPRRFVALLALLPLSLVLGLAASRARGSGESIAVRETAYEVTALALAGGVALDGNSGLAVGAAAFGLVAFLTLSRHLHWMRGPSMAQIGSVLRAASRVLAPRPGALGEGSTL